MASPFPVETPRDPLEVITPAVEGTKRVLRAAVAAKARRVVVTSSFAAIGNGWGEEGQTHVFTSKDWSKDEGLDAYTKSKLLAERAAWELVKGSETELSVINPGFVTGPTVSKDAPLDGTSVNVITRVMKRDFPAVPDMTFVWVDVRDLAVAHIRALLVPTAKEQRFLCVYPEQYKLREVAVELDKAFPGRGIPTGHLPTWVVWLGSFFDGALVNVLHQAGRSIHVDVSDTVSALNVRFRHPRQGIVDVGLSLVRAGVVPHKGETLPEGLTPLDFSPDDILDFSKVLSKA
jgi:dihydroflavonol-4-reductase